MSQKTINALVKLHGAKLRKDIQRGVKYCRAVWDFKKHPGGEFHKFCLDQYMPPGKLRRELLAKADFCLHSIGGYFGMMTKAVRRGLDVADTPLTAADELFASFSAASHYSQDLRDFKIAALAQLNFGTDSLKAPRTRADWAARRLSSVGREVVPARLLAEVSRVGAATQKFVSGFNLYLDRIDFGDPDITFPKNTRLISHWGLRDYMTDLRGKPHALKKQRAIRDLLRRVVDGEIPREIIDNHKAAWDLKTGQVAVGGRRIKTTQTQALRWEQFKNMFDSMRKVDPYTRYGNIIDNKFKKEREMSQEKIVGMLRDVLASPLAARVGAFVSGKLQRPLEAHDIYFKDFHGGAKKSKLGYNIASRYPGAGALTAAIPGILVKLGFAKKRAREIGSHIRVENSRSAGHAWRPHTPVDTQLLRVRIGSKGIDERDFSIFMHELGHCVEGVLSSYEMDYRALWGVPNTAFSEAYAFTFQDRTDQILGRKAPGNSDVTTLLRFAEVFEIAGAALAEIEFFHWLYGASNRSAAQMQRKIRQIGDSIWKKYYAPIYGPDGYGLLSVYSHILWCVFYLADYPLGYVIAYQVRKYLKGKNLAKEMERMCRLGDIYPEQWMRSAVGENVSVTPLLTDTLAALKRLGY